MENMQNEFGGSETERGVTEAFEILCEEINTFFIMIHSKPQTTNTSDDNSAEIENLIKGINFNMEEKYWKMVYLNFYIVADECLGRIYKSICMNNHHKINNQKVRLEIEDIIKNENKEDLIELLIDNTLDQNLTGISDKIKAIKKICKRCFDFEVDESFIKEIDIFRIERNLLVHSNGIVNKRALKDLSKIYEDIKINDKIEYTFDKIYKLLDLFRFEIEVLNYEIHNYYNLDKYGNPRIFKQYMQELKSSDIKLTFNEYMERLEGMNTKKI